MSFIFRAQPVARVLLSQTGAVHLGEAAEAESRFSEGAAMLQAASDVIRRPDLEMSRAKSSSAGRLGRLILIFRPWWNHGSAFEKPRRSIDRELQEWEPIDLL